MDQAGDEWGKGIGSMAQQLCSHLTLVCNGVGTTNVIKPPYQGPNNCEAILATTNPSGPSHAPYPLSHMPHSLPNRNPSTSQKQRRSRRSIVSSFRRPKRCDTRSVFRTFKPPQSFRTFPFHTHIRLIQAKQWQAENEETKRTKANLIQN